MGARLTSRFFNEYYQIPLYSPVKQERNFEISNDDKITTFCSKNNQTNYVKIL